MVSESLEFVVDTIDNQFAGIDETSDRRIAAIKKYCKTLGKFRTKRCGGGSVIISLQIMDDLKYANRYIGSVLNRLASGEVSIYNDDDTSATDVIIAAFGSDNKGVSGYSKPAIDFIATMGDHKIAPKNESPSINKGYYLRDFPTNIVDESKTEFFIIGLVSTVPNTEFDTAIVTVIGLPRERYEEITERNLKSMFGFIS